MFAQYRVYFAVGILLAAFLAGGYVTRMYYTNILNEQQVQLEKAKNELKVALDNVRIEYVVKTEYVKVKGEDRIKVVKEYVPADLVSKGFVEFHNAAAEGRSVNPMTSEEANSMSTATLQDAAGVINQNYTSCNKYIIQIESLQESLNQFEKIYGKNK